MNVVSRNTDALYDTRQHAFHAYPRKLRWMMVATPSK